MAAAQQAAAAKAAEEQAAREAQQAAEVAAAQQRAQRAHAAAEARVEGEKQRLRDERKKERLEALRKRSTGFVAPSVPMTNFSNVRDVTRGQSSSQMRIDLATAMKEAIRQQRAQKASTEVDEQQQETSYFV